MNHLLAKLPESAAEKPLMKPFSPAAEKGIVLLVIFLVALALRAIAIDVPINSDEGLWMYRGTFFARRLMDGELAETYLRHHPGVTNMWLIGSSMFLNCLWHNWHPQFWGIDQPASVRACLNQLNFPIGMWILPRIFQAGVTAGCMVAIYDLVRRLLGRPVALVAIGLLMLEPFFLAYQRYLTTDAMQADFGAVGLLAMLVYLRQPLGDAHARQATPQATSQTAPQIGFRSKRPRKWLLLSGAMMGLSILSKIPSIFFIPAVVTWLVMIEVGRSESFARRGWLRQGSDFGLWLLAIGATAFLIWPALWVAPVDTVTQLIAGLRDESQRGAFFYLGQTTDAIGLSFYPLALLYRLTPVLLVGLAIWIFTAIKDGVRRPSHALTLLPLLLASSVIWVLGLLSLSDSKIDRYINLVIPLLAVLAAIGWMRLGSALAIVIRQRQPQRILAAGMVGLLIIQSAVVVSYQPYYLTYFNPIAGLIYPVERVFMLGQGEGVDQAARWLNQSPEAKEMTAAVWYKRAFRPYFLGTSVNIPKFNGTDVPSWLTANRVILYINQYQRDLPEREMLEYFSAQPLLHSVRFHGLDYVKIYPGPVATPGDLAAIAEPQSVRVSDRIQFYGHELERDRPTSDQALQVTTYWEFADALPAESKLVLTLKNSTGESSTTADRLMGSYIAMDKVPQNVPLRESQTIPLDTLSPGRYNLTASWQVPTSQQPAASYELPLGSVEIGAGS